MAKTTWEPTGHMKLLDGREASFQKNLDHGIATLVLYEPDPEFGETDAYWDAHYTPDGTDETAITVFIGTLASLGPDDAKMAADAMLSDEMKKLAKKIMTDADELRS